MNKIRTETSTQNKECGSRSVGEIMAAVVPEFGDGRSAERGDGGGAAGTQR